MNNTAPTTVLILREAARLFSTKGFYGTSTREIADAVGIRQPSLFHHFSSKLEIARALFEYDYERSPALQRRPELPDASAPVQLFQITRREVLAQLTSDYDLRALYFSALLDEPDFANWRAIHQQALRDVEEIYRQGVEDGDFVDHEPALVVEVMNSMITQAVRWASEQQDRTTPDEVAEMTLRMVLKRPSRIPSIRKEANRLLRLFENPWPEELNAASRRLPA